MKQKSMSLGSTLTRTESKEIRGASFIRMGSDGKDQLCHNGNPEKGNYCINCIGLGGLVVNDSCTNTCDGATYAVSVPILGFFCCVASVFHCTPS
ncbi:MAG: hypothetical protein QM528_00040 [Phycisphaerales bacterium]|nr:hypothetical protein [Phycisphaerales bacterium]